MNNAATTLFVFISSLKFFLNLCFIFKFTFIEIIIDLQYCLNILVKVITIYIYAFFHILFLYGLFLLQSVSCSSLFCTVDVLLIHCNNLLSANPSSQFICLPTRFNFLQTYYAIEISGSNDFYSFKHCINAMFALQEIVPNNIEEFLLSWSLMYRVEQCCF